MEVSTLQKKVGPNGFIFPFSLWGDNKGQPTFENSTFFRYLVASSGKFHMAKLKKQKTVSVYQQGVSLNDGTPKTPQNDDF